MECQRGDDCLILRKKIMGRELQQDISPSGNTDVKREKRKEQKRVRTR